MAPSDFPNDPPRLFIPVFSWTRPPAKIHSPPAGPSLGTSHVSDSTFDTRCSLTPRTVQRLHVPVASSSMTDFTIDRRLVTVINDLTRPNRIHFRCGWHLCFHESQPSGLLHETVGKLRVEQAIDTATSFQIASQIKLSWRFCRRTLPLKVTLPFWMNRQQPMPRYTVQTFLRLEDASDDDKQILRHDKRYLKINNDAFHVLSAFPKTTAPPPRVKMTVELPDVADDELPCDEIQSAERVLDTYCDEKR